VTVRVAFPLLGGWFWTGGQSYLRNLFRVLATTAADRVIPVLTVSAGAVSGAREAFGDLQGLEMVEVPRALSGRRIMRARALLLGRDARFERWLLDQRIDLLFEATEFMGWRSRVPTLVWMPDFQHRHLPSMFEWKRLIGRELLYQMQTRTGRTIMLSSETTRRECERFYPASRGHTTVVRFAVAPARSPALSTLVQRYGLPADYLYLPNQFWKHKNHGLIVDALHRLRQRGRLICVVASGNPSDVRDPQYFPRLLRRIKQLELGDSWRLLGMIPYEDVIGLMRGSIAVINPSFVEGWSTTVEEAKALGVPLVLSDIPVHREQTSDAVFFDPNDSEAAASALLEACERFAPRLRGEARAPNPHVEEHLRAFGAAFCDAVDLALRNATAVKIDRGPSFDGAPHQ